MKEIFHHCQAWGKLISILSGGLKSPEQQLREGISVDLYTNLPYREGNPIYNQAIFFALDSRRKAPWVSLLCEEDELYVTTWGHKNVDAFHIGNMK